MAVNEERITTLRAHAARFPNSEVPLWGMAKEDVDNGMCAEAEPVLPRAVVVTRRFSMADWYLARCLSGLRRTGEARAICERGIDIATQVHESTPAEGMAEILRELDS